MHNSYLKNVSITFENVIFIIVEYKRAVTFSYHVQFGYLFRADFFYVQCFVHRLCGPELLFPESNLTGRRFSEFFSYELS